MNTIFSTGSLAFAFIVMCLGASAQPAPDTAALDELLARVTASAMRYDGHLPDFTCTEVTVRKEDRSKNVPDWRTVDTLEELVSFDSNGRVLKQLVKRNGQPAAGSRLSGFVENGLLSGAIVPEGIFGAKSKPRFRWDHWEAASGHRIAVISYEAVGVNYPDHKTRYEVKISGRVFFDDTTGNLTRTESSAVGPPGYPLGELRVETDYAPVNISSRELILPTRAVMTTTMGKRRYRNETQFSGYRKYQADATVRFDDAR